MIAEGIQAVAHRPREQSLLGNGTVRPSARCDPSEPGMNSVIRFEIPSGDRQRIRSNANLRLQSLRGGRGCLAMSMLSAALAGFPVLAVAFAAIAGQAAAAAPSNDPPVVEEPMAAVAQALASLGPVAPFGRPLTMRSRADEGQASVTLQALIDRPLRDVEAALADAQHWCSVLILHINNKGCTVAAHAPRTHIRLIVARRYDQPESQASAFDFEYQVAKATSGELSVRLNAPTGPYGMRDCSIDFDAVPAGESRTAIRMSYSYRQGGMGSLALAAYFATVGRDKVGFSITPPGTDGGEHHVGGVRGLLERNLMRYFLAVDAAAATPLVSDTAGYVRRLRDWFAATERYPLQLHEVDLETYLALKQPLQAAGVPSAATTASAPQ
jgi:hypothetical protein